MVAEILLTGTLAISAAGLLYLMRHSAKEKAAHEAEHERMRSRFHAALAHELKASNASQFSFSTFVEKCGVDPAEAQLVARDMYGRLCARVVSDGVISDRERKTMNRLASALLLDEATASSIEREAIAGRYQAEVQRVLADGRVSVEEEAALTSLRESLGLTRRESLLLTVCPSRDAYVATMKSLVRSGQMDADAREQLLRLKRALAISDRDGQHFLHDAAHELYRECFTMAIQDGSVSPQEKQQLSWLAEEAGLDDNQLRGYHAQIQEIERLSGYRNGRLPSLKTGKLLEGGETCHWDRACRYRYETRRSIFLASGNLLVTGKRIVFSSPEKTVSYAPSKILDIQRYAEAVELTLEARSGSGIYFVDKPLELEAILTGLVRKHKFLLSENFSSSMTRHIPDSVKREVWDRDGGRCVRCSATDYLEFDHIIPHGKGGANSVANVQILCRRCNLQKSDRI
jgi:tellurite resistance protein